MKTSEYTYDYFIDAFESAKETAENLVSTINEEEIFLRKPAEGKWSMGEIMSHLLQAGNQYLTQIKKPLNKPDKKLKKGSPPFTPNFAFRWFIRQVSPENKRKLPTVSSFEPIQGPPINKHEVLDDFLSLQDEFIHILKRAKLDGLDLERIKTRNPILKIVPMSLTACFGVTETHQHRHFEQIRALKKLYGI